jgi:hypothetical protein
VDLARVEYRLIAGLLKRALIERHSVVSPELPLFFRFALGSDFFSFSSLHQRHLSLSLSLMIFTSFIEQNKTTATKGLRNSVS